MHLDTVCTMVDVDAVVMYPRGGRLAVRPRRHRRPGRVPGGQRARSRSWSPAADGDGHRRAAGHRHRPGPGDGRARAVGRRQQHPARSHRGSPSPTNATSRPTPGWRPPASRSSGSPAASSAAAAAARAACRARCCATRCTAVGRGRTAPSRGRSTSAGRLVMMTSTPSSTTKSTSSRLVDGPDVHLVAAVVGAPDVRREPAQPLDRRSGDVRGRRDRAVRAEAAAGSASAGRSAGPGPARRTRRSPGRREAHDPGADRAVSLAGAQPVVAQQLDERLLDEPGVPRRVLGLDRELHRPVDGAQRVEQPLAASAPGSGRDPAPPSSRWTAGRRPPCGATRPPRPEVELGEVGQLERRHDAAAARGPVHPAVVDADQHAVAGEPHVALDAVGAVGSAPAGRPRGCAPPRPRTPPGERPPGGGRAPLHCGTRGAERDTFRWPCTRSAGRHNA